MGERMTYSCPVDDCEYEGRLNSTMNHLRMTQDDDHNELWQRFKQKADKKDGDNVDNDSNDNEEDRPKLEESFEDAIQEKDSNGENMEVKQLESGKQTESNDFEKLEDLEFSTLKQEFPDKTEKQLAKAVKVAVNNGKTRINLETGDFK